MIIWGKRFRGKKSRVEGKNYYGKRAVWGRVFNQTVLLLLKNIPK
jgi:hypothetical protein